MLRTIHQAVLAASIAFLLVVVATGCGDREARAMAAKLGPTVSPDVEYARVQRGRYLVNVIGCNDCHTPMKVGPNGPEPDMSRALSGHPSGIGKLPPATASGPWLWAGAATNTAFHGPWGTSYAMNLTPDRNTGLGIWTEDLFVRSLRTGKHWGTSRPIMPPMPWTSFRNATDEDLKSIWAYLRTLKPIQNQVPDWEPPAPTATAQAAAKGAAPEKS